MRTRRRKWVITEEHTEGEKTRYDNRMFSSTSLDPMQILIDGLIAFGADTLQAENCADQLADVKLSADDSSKNTFSVQGRMMKFTIEEAE